MFPLNYIGTVVDQMPFTPTCSADVARRWLSPARVPLLIFGWAVADEMICLLAPTANISLWWLGFLGAVIYAMLFRY
jgi:hypothetical protein